MPCEAVIGLEVHAQLATETKIFCSCPVLFGEEPNSVACPVCLGLPGALPVLNCSAVVYALRIALATECRLNKVSSFVRKNYFYPDLPKGYQITQLEQPFAEAGFLEVETESEGIHQIGINRIHLEEDAAKLFHALGGCKDECSYIDYNRAGVPLIEIVSEPDMHTAGQAGAYLRALHRLLQYLGVSEANMEQGGFRCDANVSIHPDRTSPFGEKVELKNINSFKNVERAIAFEITRQMDIVKGGRNVMRETRQWDAQFAKTIAMRSKEETNEYRYFPEPDLISFVVDEDMVERETRQLPELPLIKRRRLIDTYGLPVYDADFLVQNKALSVYFEKTVALGAAPKTVSNWIMGDIKRCLDHVRNIESFAVTPAHLAELISLIDEHKISNKKAKVVFEEIILTSQYPNIIVGNKEKYLQVSDQKQLEIVIASVLDQYPEEVSNYCAGKTKLLSFFIGHIMRATGGNADPVLVNELLRRKLDE